jgi:hypothetical protein
MTRNGLKTAARHLLVLVVVLFALLAFGGPCVIEVLWLKEALGLPYTFRVIALTPVIDESPNILSFAQRAHQFHLYRGIGLRNWGRLTGYG